MSRLLRSVCGPVSTHGMGRMCWFVSRGHSTSLSPGTTQPLVVFDLETTGTEKGRILEVAGVRIMNGAICDTYSCIVRMQRDVPAEVEHLTGISTELMRCEGRALHVVMDEFLRFLGPCPLLAHNAPFDMGFLRRELGWLKRSLPNTYLCSLALARRLMPGHGSYALHSLASALRIPYPGGVMHRALPDATVTASLWSFLHEAACAALGTSYPTLHDFAHLARLPVSEVHRMIQQGKGTTLK